jgi:hypothetical protein
MNPADYGEEARPFLDRIQSYAEAPDAFRDRWRLHFHWSSWFTAALLVAPIAWIAFTFGDLHLALKGVLAVMALIAVLPLVRDFRRPHCVRCEEEAERITARRLDGEADVITACHGCRVFKAEEADSLPLPL